MLLHLVLTWHVRVWLHPSLCDKSLIHVATTWPLSFGHKALLIFKARVDFESTRCHTKSWSRDVIGPECGAIYLVTAWTKVLLFRSSCQIDGASIPLTWANDSCRTWASFLHRVRSWSNIRPILLFFHSEWSSVLLFWNSELWNARNLAWLFEQVITNSSVYETDFSLRRFWAMQALK